MPCCVSRKAIEKIPVDEPLASGVAAADHVSPPSLDRRTREVGRADPDVIAAHDRDVRAAGGEGAFVLERRREPRGRDARPRGAAVYRAQDHELSFDRIAEGDAAARIPERHRVEECFRIGIGELQRPRLAGVGGLVDSRALSGADAQHVGDVRADRIDIAEIKLLGVGNASASATLSRRRSCAARCRRCRWPTRRGR